MDEPSVPLPGRRGAAAWWLVLVSVLALVVTGTVVGLHVVLPPAASQPAPAPVAPASSPPSSRDPAPTPSTPAEPGAPVVVAAGAGPLLPGVGAGVVYAQAATAIFRVELATGRVTRTPTPDLEEHVTFLAGAGWVLVKSRWSPTGVLVRDGHPAAALPELFDAEGLVHAGPSGRLWLQPEPSTDPRATTTLRLAGLDGRLVAGEELVAPGSAAPYVLVPDGYGTVLMANRRGVHRLVAGPSGGRRQGRLVARGTFIAAGGHRVLVRDCGSGQHCPTVLVDERTGHRTERPAAGRTLRAGGGAGTDPDAYGDAALSPDGTHLAVTASDEAGVLRAHVVDLRSGRETVLPGEGTDANANRQLAWSPNSRWLLALTDGRLRAYDTRRGTSRSVALGGERLLHLTTVHHPGW